MSFQKYTDAELERYISLCEGIARSRTRRMEQSKPCSDASAERNRRRMEIELEKARRKDEDKMRAEHVTAEAIKRAAAMAAKFNADLARTEACTGLSCMRSWNLRGSERGGTNRYKTHRKRTRRSSTRRSSTRRSYTRRKTRQKKRTGSKHKKKSRTRKR